VKGVVQFHLLHRLGQGVQDEGVGRLARLCGSGVDAGFQLVFEADGGGGHGGSGGKSM